MAIEEPEAHLHPLAQAWLAERIKGMCADGLQFILSTHSPSFLDILCLPGMHLVYKEENITRVRRHYAKSLAKHCVERGANPKKCTEETVLPFYSANSSEETLKGFFAQAVVLVEGPTEALALPIYLRACGCDTREKGIAIVPTHGKGSIPRYIRLYEAYSLRILLQRLLPWLRKKKRRKFPSDTMNNHKTSRKIFNSQPILFMKGLITKVWKIPLGLWQ